MASLLAGMPHGRRRYPTSPSLTSSPRHEDDAAGKHKGSLTDLALAGRRVAVGLGVHGEA